MSASSSSSDHRFFPQPWPDWVKFQVFSRLVQDFKDLYRCERVCKDWREYLSGREGGRAIYREATFKEVLGAPFGFDKRKLHLETLVLAARKAEPHLAKLLLELKGEKDRAEGRRNGQREVEVEGEGQGETVDAHVRSPCMRSFLKRFYSHNGSLLWPWVIRFNQFKLNLKSKRDEDVKVFFAIGSHEFDFSLDEGFHWRVCDHESGGFGFSAGLEYHAYLPEKWRYACDLLTHRAAERGIEGGENQRSLTQLSYGSITFGVKFTGDGKCIKLLDSEGHAFLAGFGTATGEHYEMRLGGSDGHFDWDPVSWDCECTGFTVQRTKLTAYCHMMEIDPDDLSLVCSPSFSCHWKELIQNRDEKGLIVNHGNDPYCGSAREILQASPSIKLSFTVQNRHYIVDLNHVRGEDLPFDSGLGYSTSLVKKYTWCDAEGWDKYGEDWGSADLCIMTGSGGPFRKNVLLIGRTCIEIPFGQRIGNRFEVKQLFWLKDVRGHLPQPRYSTRSVQVQRHLPEAVQNAVKDYHLFEVVHHFVYNEDTQVVSDHVVRITDATIFTECVLAGDFHNFMVGE